MQIHIWVIYCVLSTCIYCMLNTKFNLTELHEHSSVITFIFPSFCIFFSILFFFFYILVSASLPSSPPSLSSLLSFCYHPPIHSSPVSFMWVSCSPSWPLTHFVAEEDLEVLILLTLLTLLPKCYNVSPIIDPGFHLKIRSW